RQQVDLFGNGGKGVGGQLHRKGNPQADFPALAPETPQTIASKTPVPGFLERFAKANGAVSAAIYAGSGEQPVDSWMGDPALATDNGSVHARRAVKEGDRTIGFVELTAHLPLNVQEQKSRIELYNSQWIQMRDGLKNLKYAYTMLMVLITLFVLFVTVWIALFLAKQISVPITALLDAADEVRKGNLRHRVEVRATDELASLVRGFN